MMIVYCKFFSTEDFAPIERAHQFVNILRGFRLHIDRAGHFEPVRTEFQQSKLQDFWSQGNGTSGVFMFTGRTAVGFSGMVSWNRGLRPGAKVFNLVSMEMNLRKPVDCKYIEDLADALFQWSEAAYGMVSDRAIYRMIRKPGTIHEAVPGLYWLNYFGAPYVGDTRFNIPEESIRLGSGVKIRLADRIDDPVLGQTEALDAQIKALGEEWFGNGPCKQVPAFKFANLWG